MALIEPTFSNGTAATTRVPAPAAARARVRDDTKNGHNLTSGADGDVLGRLESIAVRAGGLDGLADGLATLQRLLATDLIAFEDELALLSRGSARVERAAHHLVDLGGKRLRPMCVMLASKLGAGSEGLESGAVDVAVAAELVHSATLLHDDVVDVGDLRRGAPAARTIYGNATSIFAGDWLLVQALKRVRRADPGDGFAQLLDVIEEMILAESIQLDVRGTLNLSLEEWLQVVEGKTAALFRWAMHTGGRIGGLNSESCRRLEEFGLHLGVAFQATDDLLDLTGDPETTGKELFADLREGKMTWPIIAGMARDRSLRPVIESALDAREGGPDVVEKITESLRASGALDDCRTMALQRVQLAVGSLTGLPCGPVLEALKAAARAVVERTH